MKRAKGPRVNKENSRLDKIQKAESSFLLLMSRMLKKTLDSLLTAKESDELISAFDQIGNIIIV